MKKNKLLVIKPPYRSFPMGFAYVLACLDKWRIPFDFVDTTLPFLDYRRYLRKNNYLAVASGGLIGQFRFFSEIVDNVRKINPGLPVILGGNITKDIKYDFLFDKIGVDFGVIGEAETSLPYLVNALAKGNQDFSSVPGLLYKDKSTGEIIRNMPQRLCLESENMFPAWQYFDMDYYSREERLPFFGPRSFMPILTGRGCVGKCSFCSPTIGSFRMRPIKHVMEEMEFLNTHYDFDWFNIFNEMAFQSKEQVLIFCDAYRKLKINKQWFCSFRTDVDFDRDTFLAIKKAGCVSALIGIESGSNKILKLMRKETTVEQTKRFYQLALDVGLPCNGSFMVGNEGETEKEIRESVDMVIDYKFNTDASLTSSYPGTLNYKNALKRGLFSDEWTYLQKFRFNALIWDYTWVDRFYVNITDIPDELFWDVAVNELRRFYTNMFNRYQAKKQKFKLLFGTICIEAKGVCSGCGQAVILHPPFIFLEMEAFCPKCFFRVYFNIYESGKFIKHFAVLAKELRDAQNIVACGVYQEASAFLRIDRFGLNYDKIKGFLEIKPQAVWSARFINKPRFNLADLMQIKPDTILILDDEIGDSELLIRKFYIDNNISTPRILHLLPISENYNNLSFVWQTSLVKFSFLIKVIILKIDSLLRRIVTMRSRKMIIRKIIHKMRYFYLKVSDLWQINKKAYDK